MSEIVLHHVPQSRSFRTLWLLHEIGVRFSLQPHSFFDKSLRDPAFLAMSPAGRVPALAIDDTTLFESGAIAQYLTETRAPEMGRAVADPERGRFLEWVHFSETMASLIANLTQHHIILRDASMRSETVMRIEAKRLENCLRAVGVATTGHDWLLPSGFSAADIAVGYAVEIGARFVDLGALPAVAAYAARLQARPAFQLAMSEDGDAQIYLHDFYAAPAKP
jgi:glutathione S-transferase